MLEYLIFLWSLEEFFTGDDYSYGVGKKPMQKANFSFHHVQPGRVNLRYYVQSEEKKWIFYHIPVVLYMDPLEPFRMSKNWILKLPVRNIEGLGVSCCSGSFHPLYRKSC